MSWKMVKLGDACDIKNGRDHKKVNNPNGIYPIIGSGGIMGYADDYLCDKCATIIGRKGSINNPIYVESKFWNVDTAFALCTKEALDSKFFYYFCTIYNFEKHNKATTLPSLTKTDLLEIQIPLPPLATQKRIAEILDAADALRRKDHELLKKYDELAQAIFIDMFGDPVKNEKGVSLNTLIKINPTKSEIKIDDNDEVTFTPMSNIGEDGSFNNTEIRKYAQVKSGFTYFREDDVLFAKITPCMENGKGAIAKELKNGIGFGSTEFHILRPNENLNSQFLFHLTKLNSFRVFAEANMTGSAGQKRVPTDFFKKIKIDTTRLEKQDEFAKAMNILLLQKHLINKDIIDSKNLFLTLIQKAFKGELVS